MYGITSVRWIVHIMNSNLVVTPSIIQHTVAINPTIVVWLLLQQD